MLGGGVPSQEENVDFPKFLPDRDHLLLKRVYRYYYYHNKGSHLGRGVPYRSVWQRCWC